MLCLIINEKGQPEHRWSIDPAKDFASLMFLGPAIKDENGNPEDSANLELVDGRVVVSQTKKALSIKNQSAKEAERQAAENTKKEAVEFLKTYDLTRLKSSDLPQILGAIVTHLGLK